MSEKTYKPDMSPFFRRGAHAASGMTFHSVFIKDELFDKLQSIEKGGMLVIKLLDPDKVTDANKNLSGYLSYKSPAELAAEKEMYKSKVAKASEDTI